MQQYLLRHWWWRRPHRRSPLLSSHNVSYAEGVCTLPRAEGAAGHIQRTPSRHPTGLHPHTQPGTQDRREEVIVCIGVCMLICDSFMYCTTESQLGSCDWRRLGSGVRRGVAKRSWLRSASSVLPGEPDSGRRELLGVSSTKERE